MKSPDQHRRVEHRSPSPAICLARTMPHGGLVFREPGEGLAQHFIPYDEAENIYGGPDGWIAHMLLKHVAGDPRKPNGGAS